MTKTRTQAVTVLVLLAAAGTVAFTIQRGHAMSAMNCETFDTASFAAALAAEAAEPLALAPGTQDPVRTTTFVLQGFGPPGEDTTLTIKSAAGGGLIYKGPLQTTLAVTAPERLFRGKGRDHFRVMVANPRTRQICVAEHGATFWRAGEHVTIELLPQRETDRHGLPIAFKVSVAS